MAYPIKIVQCKRCGVVFQRFASQPIPKNGWFCSGDCKSKARLELIGVACEDCGSLMVGRKAAKCVLCAKMAKLVSCENCGTRFKPKYARKNRKRLICSAACRVEHAAKRRRQRHEQAKVVINCRWCGIASRRGHEGIAFCGSKCEQESKHLKRWAHNRAKKAAKHQSRLLNQAWIAAKLRAMVWPHLFSEDKWLTKIKVLLYVNQFRDVLSNKANRTDIVLQDRNRHQDWKWGGAWGRILYSEMRRLKRIADRTEDQKWMHAIQGKLSSQTKRLAKKRLTRNRRFRQRVS